MNKRNGICPKCEYQICRCKDLNEQMIKLEKKKMNKQKRIKVEIEILGTKETKKQILKGVLVQSLCNDFLNRNETILSVSVDKPNYEQGFNILYEYFDSINDEEKPKVDKRLKRCGL